MSTHNGLTSNYMYRMLTGVNGKYQLTVARSMEQFFQSSMATGTDGTFKAVCLSGIRTGDGIGSGIDENDARMNGQFLEIVVRPLTPFGDIMPDPRGSTDPNEIISRISNFKYIYNARSDFEFSGQDAISFGQIVKCYFEEGSITNSDFRELRFVQPDADPDTDPSFVKLASIKGMTTGVNAFATGNASLLGKAQDTPASTSPAQLAFVEKLGKALKSKGLKFHVTDRSRTVDDQMSRIMNKYKGNGRAEVIATYGKNRGAKMVKAIESNDTATFRTLASKSSRHLKGNAIDIRSWHYDDKELTIVLAEIKKLGGKSLVEPISGNCWEKSGRNVVNAKRNGAPGGSKGAICYNEHVHIDIPEDFK